MKELKVISLYFFLIVNLFSGLHLEAKSILSGDIVEGQQYVPNFLKQKGHFEKNANGTSAYADAAGTRPVDGSGGAPTLSCTRTTSSPIDGDGSLLITKDAANRQGQGCSIQFTIDSAYKAKVLQIEFDYLVASGTFTAGSSSADSDLIVYIYDVTNSTLIEPSSIKLLSNSTTISDHFVANFQTSATGTTYNLILHQATTSASAYTVKADNLEVKPSKYIYGTPISDWVSYTPTITGFGTPSNVSFRSRRVGDSLEVKGYYTTGTNTASQAQITLGYGGANANVTIDTTKVQTGSLIGNVANSGSGSTYFGAYAIAPSSAQNYFNISMQTSTSGALTAVNGNSFANSSNMSVELSVPITGWSSSTQVSDGYDGRLIGARVYLDGGTTVTSGSAFIFSTKSHDKTNSYDTSNGRFTAPSSGIYKISALITYASSAWTAGNTNNLQLYKNGSFHSFLDANDIQASVTAVIAVRGSAQIELNAGDYLTIVPSFTGARSSISNAGLNWASFEKLQAPTTISATEVVAARYTTSSQSLGNGTVDTVILTTKDFDTHNAYNTSTGLFTCPTSGIYQVNFTATTGARSSAVWDLTNYVYVNSTNKAQNNTYSGVNTVVHLLPPQVSTAVYCNSGDTISGRARAGYASTSLDGTAAANHIEIFKIK